MGAADVVPGVSGGTVALIVGIYTELIDSIKNITLKKVWDFLASLLFCWNKSKFGRIKSASQSLNLNFLLPLALGIGTAIIIASKYIPMFIKSYPQESDALFFGLILASIYVPYSQIENSKFFHFVFLLIIALLTFNLVGPDSNLNSSDHNLIKIFSTGALAICAMILPGLSGAYIMKVLGEYVYVLDNLHQALKFNLDSLLIVCVFVFGIIIGLALFSRVLSWMLHHFQSITMAGLAGLMLGALRSVWPYDNLPTSFSNHDLTLLLYFFAGIGITFTLIYFDNAFKKQ